MRRVIGALGMLAVLGFEPSTALAKCSDTSGFEAAQRLIDEAAPCSGPRRAYVANAKKALKRTPLSAGCRRAFLRTRIVQSTCGRAGVICCDRKGTSVGSYKPTARACKGSGTVCMGGSSVGTACSDAAGCATTTTVTTSSSTSSTTSATPPTTLPTSITTTTTTTTTSTLPVGAVCPLRENPSWPRQVTFAVTGSGSDLDLGWTGLSHGFPAMGGGSLAYCLSGCDGTVDTECNLVGSTGPNSLNGELFGPPVPILSAGLPACLVNRFQEGTLTGSFDLSTGKVSDLPARRNPVDLFVDTYLRVGMSTAVCPRCEVEGVSGEQALGVTGRCDQTSRTPGASCVVEGVTTVVGGEGDPEYTLSRDCVPASDAQNPTVMDVRMRLGTGLSTLAGSPPCPDALGPQSAHDSCGAMGTCDATCTGAACVKTDTLGRCEDAKGGISQVCCSGDTTRPCFPTRNGGVIERTGAPAVSGQTGALAAVFCVPRTGWFAPDVVAGLPGPGALILPMQVSVLGGQ